MSKPRLAVHKFTSCDGCQLAILNMGEDLLLLHELVDVVHFAEAGPLAPNAKVDIALVEGSVSTPDERERITRIRENSRWLITMGACATSGGIQALRNFDPQQHWVESVYPRPEFIASLQTSTPISDHVRVDFQLWGCPVNSRQVIAALRSLLWGVSPLDETDSVCLECKRQNNVCVMVTQNKACMGAVTRTGCGALCPRFGRACYACYGPAPGANTLALTTRLEGFGIAPEAVARQYHFIHSQAEPFYGAGLVRKEK